MPSPLPNQRPRFAPGAALLGLATLVAAASLSLALPTAHAIYCDRLAPLGVLAALAATLIALCFRALAAAPARSLLAAALLLSAISLFASTRFIVRYHAACAGVEQQLRELKQHTGP
jgi:hypothetical protein